MPIQKTKRSTIDPKVAQLNKKLVTTLMGIAILTVVLFLSVGLFAPQVGYLFGFFSKNRNDMDDTTIKPNPPIFAKIPKATKDEVIILNGYAQPGLTIVLYVNGPEVAQNTTGADGVFTFTDVKLINGQNTLFAKAIDSHNVESDASAKYSVYVDKEKPKIEITKPKEGETVRNLDKRIEITGKVSEKAQVKVNDRIAIVKPDLTFELLLGVQESGSLDIKIEATDEAGNTEKKELKVKYEKSS